MGDSKREQEKNRKAADTAAVRNIENIEKDNFNYEEALEIPFRIAFENAAIGMTLVSVTGKWLRVNQEWCDMIGYTEEELLTRDFPQITHPADMEKNMALFRQTLEGKIDYFKIEKRYLHKNGSVVWGNLCASLIRDENEKPLYFVSQIENITARKKSEEALRKSEANLKVIFDTTDTSYALLDNHLHLVSFNKYYADFLKNEIGVTVKTGDPLSAHFNEERKHALTTLIPKVLDGQYLNYEVPFPQPGGLIHWYYVRLNPIIGPEQEILGLLIAIDNITPRKEEELQKEKAAKALMARNKELELFTHLMSHNVRSHIARLVGLTDLLIEYDISEEEKQHTISGISQSAKELDEVVRNINSILMLKSTVNEE